MKKQVKLTLDEEVWKKLNQEARNNGLSLAAHLRQIIYQKQLKIGVKVKSPKKQKTTLQRMADLL